MGDHRLAEKNMKKKMIVLTCSLKGHFEDLVRGCYTCVILINKYYVDSRHFVGIMKIEAFCTTELNCEVFLNFQILLSMKSIVTSHFSCRINGFRIGKYDKYGWAVWKKKSCFLCDIIYEPSPFRSLVVKRHHSPKNLLIGEYNMSTVF